MPDLLWICVAFALGFLAKQIYLPPLIGYLATGFMLLAADIAPGPLVGQLADLGVTLLLFTIGLKLRLGGLLRPHVWGVALIHMAVSLGLLGLVANGLGVPFPTAFLIGFALAFSSTVFAVKVLEDKGEMGSLYGQTAIGVLIIQDLVAVVFLAFSAGKVPTVWSPLLLVGLVPLRWILRHLMHRAGHDELLVLFGLTLTVGSYVLFEAVGIKGDLGALIVGSILASHPKAKELAHTLLSLKDFFLVGFFITIGLNGLPTWETLGLALLLVAILPLKSLLYFFLFNGFKLRSRSSFLASLGLSNYSEFGLIIAVVGVSQGWLPESWLLTIALALALSFVLASPINVMAHAAYDRLHLKLRRFQRAQRLPEETEVHVGDATTLVFGMGRVGRGAYDHMVSHTDEKVLGLDMNGEKVERLREQGRHVIQASALDSDFWDRFLLGQSKVHLIFLAMPDLEENLYVTQKLTSTGFAGRIAAIVKYPEDSEALREAGAHHIFNFYTEAGSGFAADVTEALLPSASRPRLSLADIAAVG